MNPMPDPKRSEWQADPLKWIFAMTEWGEEAKAEIAGLEMMVKGAISLGTERTLERDEARSRIAGLEAQNRHDDAADTECRNLLMEENDNLRAQIATLKERLEQPCLACGFINPAE